MPGRAAVALLAVGFGALLAACDSGEQQSQGRPAETVTVTVTSEAENPAAPIGRYPRIRCGVDSGLDPTVGVRERHAIVVLNGLGDGQRLRFPHLEATFSYHTEDHRGGLATIRVAVFRRGKSHSDYVYQGRYLLPAQDDANVINQLSSFTPGYFRFDEQAGITGLQTVVDRETGAYLRYAWITVSRSLTPDGQAKTPKTAAGVRSVPLVPELRRLLVQWRLRSLHTRPGDLVVCTVDGGPVQERNVRRALEDAKQAAGLAETEGRLSMHALRHSYCSALATSGLAPTTLARITGHTDPGFTLRVYARDGRDDNVVAAEVLAVAAAAGFGA
jgi:hypothetical protein